jgi:hypothetical protein
MDAMPSKGRQAYLGYLAENELDETTVLPIVADTSDDRRLVEALAQAASDKGDTRSAEVIRNALNASTNDLLQLMDRSLRTRCERVGLAVPEHAFAGVFPTNTLNAHVVQRSGWDLVLVNTGTFELLEAVLSQFLSLTPGIERATAQNIAKEIEAYCTGDGIRHRGDAIARPTRDDSRRGSVDFLSACEEFMLAHEYGHLVLGHLGPKTVRMAIPGHGVIDVVEKSKHQEYDADLWAADAIARIYNASHDGGGAAILACGAPLLFLLLTNLIEAWARRANTLSDTHPPAWERYVALRFAYAKAGLNGGTGMAKTFAQFCYLVGQELGLDVRHEDATLLVCDHVAGLVADGLQAALPLVRQTSVFVKAAPEKSTKPKVSLWRRLF